MRILELRAARGWSIQQTAERFHVTEETIASWMRRLDEGGEAGLVRAEERKRPGHGLRWPLTA
jgi:transposase